jgi:hypothetical protein
MNRMHVASGISRIGAGLLVALAWLGGCSSSTGGGGSNGTVPCEGTLCSGMMGSDGGGSGDSKGGGSTDGAGSGGVECGTLTGPVSGKLVCKTFSWTGTTGADGGTSSSQVSFGVLTADGAWSLTGGITLSSELAATTYTPNNANSGCSLIPAGSGNVEGGWLQTSAPPSDTTPTDHLGTFTLTVTSVGTIQGSSGYMFDTNPHGTMTMTLVDAMMKQADEQVSLTF